MFPFTMESKEHFIFLFRGENQAHVIPDQRVDCQDCRDLSDGLGYTAVNGASGDHAV